MREHAEMIANLDTMISLIANAGTGYGGPNMILELLRSTIAM